MSEYLVTTEDLKTIADAIREKSEETNTFLFSEFADKIRKIPQGGGSSVNTTKKLIIGSYGPCTYQGKN